MKSIFLTWFLFISLFAVAQQAPPAGDVQPGQFDQGKMWTFENPPYDYFNKTYGLSLNQEWMDDARMSALRFASWCSASFISETGLILTNQHCSRSVVGSVMKANEDFDKFGFYAETQADERRIPNLYVDQLVQIADITAKVQAMKDIPADSALRVVQYQYRQDKDWKDLKMETRTFYSGEKYSLYGYKRYNDIRLVLYPELSLGFFGGDPDNFTYPRYDLDFTLFRAYDENGNPLHPANYFKINPEGAAVNEAVFVIGNPGGTGRYLTMAQLDNLRDLVYPMNLSYFRSRMKILRNIAANNTGEYNKDSLNNIIFDLSNSEKAYSGILKGLNDPVTMAKKENKEKLIRSNVAAAGADPWNSIETTIAVIRNFRPEVMFLRSFPNDFAIQGKIYILMNLLVNYEGSFDKKDTAGMNEMKKKITGVLHSFNFQLETDLFTDILKGLKEYSRQDYINDVLDGKTPEERVKELVNKSTLLHDPDKFFGWKESKLDKEPLVEMANILVPKYQEASKLYAQKVKEIEKENKVIINLQYETGGFTSPPDATFSLRISDGTVKGYEYNGTIAPPFTTYYGMYDRYYSHGQVDPWDLPEKWKSPSPDMLKVPLDFVCTADIIGGNSGSPVINSKRELVGLVFDGNVESLPGYFIFDDTYNRTVAVHVSGILASLKYIYHADRILGELK